MLLLEAVEAVQPVIEKAGLQGDLKEAASVLKYAAKCAMNMTGCHTQARWTKAEARAVNLVLDAMTALAERVANERNT